MSQSENLCIVGTLWATIRRCDDDSCDLWTERLEVVSKYSIRVVGPWGSRNNDLFSDTSTIWKERCEPDTKISLGAALNLSRVKIKEPSDSRTRKIKKEREWKRERRSLDLRDCKTVWKVSRSISQYESVNEKQSAFVEGRRSLGEDGKQSCREVVSADESWK